jgi:hypothetical protein
VLVPKLDRLSRAVAFIAGLMAQRVPFIRLSCAPTLTRSCCISTQRWRRRERRQYPSTLGPPSPLENCKARSWATRRAQGKSAALGRDVQTRAADRFAETVLPMIVSLQKSGVTSLRGIAIALNNRGVRTARGGDWQVSNVRNILARAATPTGEGVL